jgi:AcrR family transcriptional regulator
VAEPQRASPSARLRLPRGERERRIVEAAAALFAEEGFAATTRRLAERLGVTQALLYRYFRSKERLIERVFEVTFDGLAERARPQLLEPDGRPLEARLIDFYAGYVAASTPTSTRLFVRASMDGLELARRYAGPLTGRVLAPVVAALRRDAGLPGFDRAPMMHGERELAMVLHGGVAFLQIRRHLYGMPIQEDPRALIALQVRVLLPGALAELRRLHATPGQVRQLR